MSEDETVGCNAVIAILRSLDIQSRVAVEECGLCSRPLVMLFVVASGVCYVTSLNSYDFQLRLMSLIIAECAYFSFALIPAPNVLTTTKATTLLRYTTSKSKKVAHSTIYTSTAVHKSRLFQ